MSVNIRLKKILSLKGMNIKEFSESSGLAYRTAQNYLSGDREPNIAGLIKINTHLGVDINWLLTGEGVPFLDEDTTVTENLLPDEQELLTEYREATDTSKQIILTIAKTQEKKGSDIENRQVS